MTTNPYTKRMVETATPVQLVSLLYDRGVAQMTTAQQALERDQAEQAHEALLNSQRVVAELMDSLDMEAGGEFAQNLRRVYTFVWERLVQANLRKASEPIAEAMEVWQSISDVWTEATHAA